MSIRYKILILIMALVVIVPVAVWAGEYIPVPTNAQQVNTEKRLMQGSEFTLTYYTSMQDVDAIKEFYRNRLPTLGWKEKELAKEIGQLQGVTVNTSLNTMLGQNLIFEKGSDMLIVNFMPTGFSKDGKTRFSVSRGKVDLNKPPLPEASAVSELVAKPKKDIAPTYPGASLTNLYEGPRSLRATYFTQDDIEQVIAFYKSKMANYGWYLNSEKPIEKVEFGDAGEYDISKDCPTCPKTTVDIAKSMETYLAELRFSNQRGDTYNVILSNVVASQGTPTSLNMTTILVHYEEKK